MNTDIILTSSFGRNSDGTKIEDILSILQGVDDIEQLSLEQRCAFFKDLQYYLVWRANENGHVLEDTPIGPHVDEAQYPEEILQLLRLVQSFAYSQDYYDCLKDTIGDLKDFVEQRKYFIDDALNWKGMNIQQRREFMVKLTFSQIEHFSHNIGIDLPKPLVTSGTGNPAFVCNPDNPYEFWIKIPDDVLKDDDLAEVVGTVAHETVHYFGHNLSLIPEHFVKALPYDLDRDMKILRARHDPTLGMPSTTIIPTIYWADPEEYFARSYEAMFVKAFHCGLVVRKNQTHSKSRDEEICSRFKQHVKDIEARGNALAALMDAGDDYETAEKKVPKPDWMEELTAT